MSSAKQGVGEAVRASAAALALLTAAMSVAEPALARERTSVDAVMGAHIAEGGAQAKGVYVIECLRPDGTVRWRDVFHNTVVTVGKNLILDKGLNGSSYTAVEYMLLISSASYSAISAADTMSSHAGWLEAGNANAPTYTSPRKTAAWSAASSGSISLSSALSFAITGTGTIKGAALVGGTGAVSTIDNTAGTLISAGLFSGGDRAVINGDTVNVSYSMSL